MLKAFVEEQRFGAKGMRLLSHAELVKWYQGIGWDLVGKSAVVHGEKEWWELKVDFR